MRKRVSQNGNEGQGSRCWKCNQLRREMFHISLFYCGNESRWGLFGGLVAGGGRALQDPGSNRVPQSN